MRFAILIAVGLLAPLAVAQVASDANRAYRSEEGRANIAKTLGDPHRDERQKPKELVDALGIKRGWTVADAGTGIGYMLPWLSAAVGPKGKVFAEDIANDFISKARERVAKEKLTNVEFILGTDRDPKLPAKKFDMVFTLDTYHHFDYPAEMLGHFHASLKNKGRLVIVDFYSRPGAMGNTDATKHIRADQAEVIREVEAAGFRLIETKEHLPKSQYIAIFEKQKSASR